MANVPELAAGNTEASTPTITCPLNGTIQIGMFVASGFIDPTAAMDIYALTPGANQFVGRVTGNMPPMAISCAGDYIATRRAGPTFGIYSNKS